MDRRKFVLRAAVLGVAPILSSCSLKDIFSPEPDPPFVEAPSVVELSASPFPQAVQAQRCEQWCWAASISMIFGHYGFDVLQEQIVAQTYGAVVCLPSSTTTTIGRDLSRQYVDSRGRRFTSRVPAVYDPFNGLYSLTNARIISELAANRPLLYCNTSHAMVLCSVSYFGSPSNPNIVAASVIDPWPYSPRTHSLNTSELYDANRGGSMTFLAAVAVS